MSENMAESCKSYITSYVLDHDIVPRLTVESMEHLRNEILDTIARIKVTKFKAAHAKPTLEQAILVHDKDEIPPSKFLEKLDDFHRYQDGLKESRATRAVKLHPPGRIVHLVGTRDSRNEEEPTLGEPMSEHEDSAPFDSYTAHWAHRDDLAEIIISSHFLKDHSSLNMLDQLEKAAARFDLSTPFIDETTVRLTEDPPQVRPGSSVELEKQWFMGYHFCYHFCCYCEILSAMLINLPSRLFIFFTPVPHLLGTSRLKKQFLSIGALSQATVVE